MRIQSDIVAVNTTSVPRKVFRCKSYRNLSQLPSGSCGTSTYFDDKIIEEEDEAMVEGGSPNNTDGKKKKINRLL